MKNILVLKINDISQVAEARRLVSYAASSMGFKEQDTGRVSLIVTELTNNLIKHCRTGGEFLVSRISDSGSEGLELISIDRGPGMKNVAECMRDGYSTAGSPGTGLGSINRMSDYFDIYSIPDQGTIVLSRVMMKKNNTSRVEEKYFEAGTILLPKPNQEVSGDKSFYTQNSTKAKIIVADGLGHGSDAMKAAAEAIKAFESSIDLPLDHIMRSLHGKMTHTRGAAVALCEINANTNSLQYCGIGNISGTILTQEGLKSLISYSGIVGHEMRKVQTMNYNWPDNALLIMHSDGLLSRWNFDKYPGLFLRSVPIICAILYRDFSRGNDDLLIFGIRKRLKREIKD